MDSGPIRENTPVTQATDPASGDTADGAAGGGVMGFSLLILVGIALLVAGIARLARGGASRRSHLGGGVFMSGTDDGGQHHHHHGGFGGHHHGGHHGGGFGGGGHHGGGGFGGGGGHHG